MRWKYLKNNRFCALRSSRYTVVRLTYRPYLSNLNLNEPAYLCLSEKWPKNDSINSHFSLSSCNSSIDFWTKLIMTGPIIDPYYVWTRATMWLSCLKRSGRWPSIDDHSQLQAFLSTKQKLHCSKKQVLLSFLLNKSTCFLWRIVFYWHNTLCIISMAVLNFLSRKELHSWLSNGAF